VVWLSAHYDSRPYAAARDWLSHCSKADLPREPCRRASGVIVQFGADEIARSDIGKDWRQPSVDGRLPAKFRQRSFSDRLIATVACDGARLGVIGHLAPAATFVRGHRLDSEGGRRKRFARRRGLHDGAANQKNCDGAQWCSGLPA